MGKKKKIAATSFTQEYPEYLPIKIGVVVKYRRLVLELLDAV